MQILDYMKHFLVSRQIYFLSYKLQRCPFLKNPLFFCRRLISYIFNRFRCVQQNIPQCEVVFILQFSCFCKNPGGGDVRFLSDSWGDFNIYSLWVENSRQRDRDLGHTKPQLRGRGSLLTQRLLQTFANFYCKKYLFLYKQAIAKCFF